MLAATIVIAIATVAYAIVACLQLAVYREQKRLAARSLKLALYDKRLAVFHALTRFMAKAISAGDLTNDQLRELLRDSAEIQFLFPAELDKVLHDVYAKGNELHDAMFKLRGSQYPAGSDARDEVVREARRASEWFERELQSVIKKFRPYLDFKDL